MTDTADTLQQISDWFAAKGTAGLILPSGWFGRPYDNQHQLTWSHARASRILVELDDRLLLVLNEPGPARVDGRDLTVPFRRLVLDRQSYGLAMTRHTDVFETGDLTFVGYR